MTAGAFTPDSSRRNQKVAHFENIIDPAAHPQHNNGFKIIQIGQAIYNQSCLGRSDAKVDHGAVFLRSINNSEVALGIFAFGFLLKTLDILLEIGDQHMVTELFQFTVRIPLQCLSYIFMFFKRHSKLLLGSHRAPLPLLKSKHFHGFAQAAFIQRKDRFAGGRECFPLRFIDFSGQGLIVKAKLHLSYIFIEL